MTTLSFTLCDREEKGRPGCVVVVLVQQPVSQHIAIFIDEDVLAAINADQEANDV